MSININCKKKWHPSRYETKKEVELIKKKIDKEVCQKEKNNEDTRRMQLNDTSERMSWMTM